MSITSPGEGQHYAHWTSCLVLSAEFLHVFHLIYFQMSFVSVSNKDPVIFFSKHKLGPLSLSSCCKHYHLSIIKRLKNLSISLLGFTHFTTWKKMVQKNPPLSLEMSIYFGSHCDQEKRGIKMRNSVEVSTQGFLRSHYQPHYHFASHSSTSAFKRSHPAV